MFYLSPKTREVSLKFQTDLLPYSTVKYSYNTEIRRKYNCESRLNSRLLPSNILRKIQIFENWKKLEIRHESRTLWRRGPLKSSSRGWWFSLSDVRNLFQEHAEAVIRDVLWNNRFEKVRKMYRKTLALESLFDILVGLQPATLLKSYSSASVFLWIFRNF